MFVFGQRSPIKATSDWLRLFAWSVFWAILAGAASCAADELNARLRFAWGSGGQAPQKWSGKITIDGAKLDKLLPLGIEADEAAAVRLDQNEIIVAPLVRRVFDGCDVTVRADEAAIVRIHLQSTTSAAVKSLEVPLSQILAKQFRAPLDELGSYFLVNRAPGDILRVHIDRPHLVFSPGESWELRLDADLKQQAAKGPITIDAQLNSAAGPGDLWHVSKPYDAASTEAITIALSVPTSEGAYRLKLTAHFRDGIAGRLMPWEKPTAIAARDVEFVVVDPKRRLPRLTNDWEAVATIEPAKSDWWQRLPQWTSIDKLPAFSTPRPLGNVKPLPVAGSPLSQVELPLSSSLADEPSWQAYLLPVRRVGEPHAVEIEIPRGLRQHAAVSIIEPDAAGRVLSFSRDAGFYCDGRVSPGVAASAAVETHRIVFWPRTRSPVLLLANRSSKNAVQYGKIRLLRRSVLEPANLDESSIDSAEVSPQRLAAAYISTPRFADSLGAPQELDAASDLSVHGWNTFLQGANRLAQELHAAGYNAAIVSVAADGGSLAPIEGLGASPRFDTRPLGTSGADPLPKDVLEVVLRVFDRENLRLIPAIELATPLPGLEAIKSQKLGGKHPAIEWIGAKGRTWQESNPAETAAAPHYNLLQAAVQTQIDTMVDQLLARYGSHRALSGLAVQLSANGYGVLPGVAWGFDDATVKRFLQTAKVEVPAEAANDVQSRARLVLTSHLEAWKSWRIDELTKFYSDLAERIQNSGKNRRLVLCTEELLNSPATEPRLRQLISGRASLDEVAKDLGVDLKRLSATPGLSLLRSRRLGAVESIDARASEWRINTANEWDQLLASDAHSGELNYCTSSRLRLPSFDGQSPFGSDRTFLSLNGPSYPLGSEAMQWVAASLAVRDFAVLADGSELAPLVENDAQIAARRIFRELPLDCPDTHAQRHDPITMRVYREQESTTVCLVNESPWSVEVSLPLDFKSNAVWRGLGAIGTADPSGGAELKETTAGSFSAGSQTWTLTMPPYGIQARRFSSPGMQIGRLTPRVAKEAHEELAHRIAAIEERMPNLNVERAYNQLQNPQFEIAMENGRLAGWQPRVGEAGSVDVASEAPVDAGGADGHSLHLHSVNPLGVAVQSHLFPIPSTGQLLVRVKVRAEGLQPDAKLYAWVEYQAAGDVQPPRYASLGAIESLGPQWKDVEAAFDDLPLASGGQMRIQFHLAGTGQVWVDSVRLYDLHFTQAQQVELGKRAYAARAALEEGQWMDCQRLVDGYWPRRVVELVPPAQVASRPVDSEHPADPSNAATSRKSLGERVRGIVPKILR
jgi:hypothetical protein